MLIINPTNIQTKINFSLSPGEYIIAFAKPDRNRYIYEFIVYSILIGIFIFSILLLVLSPISASLEIILAILLFGSMIFSFIILSRNSYEGVGYFLTYRRLIVQSGVINNLDIIPLEHIQNVAIKRTLTDIIFNTYTLYIFVNPNYNQFRTNKSFNFIFKNKVKIKWLSQNEANQFYNLILQMRSYVLRTLQYYNYYRY
jgi:hypothetical protein